MIIYLGADHAGFSQKESIKKWLNENKYQVADRGATELNSTDDYNEFAREVAKEIHENPINRGILFCHSAGGMAIAANRFKHVRAITAWNEEVATESKTHNDANVLVIPTGYVSEEETKNIITSWLNAQFLAEDKYIRRNQKLDE